MRPTVLFILIVIEAAYLIAGGFIFWALESQAEKQHKKQQTEFNLTTIIANLTALFPCVPADDLRKFASRILEAERNDIIAVDPSNDWDIHGSIFFAITVVTTIGYGTVTPATDGGQLFCCCFAFVGIPFTMVILLGIGEIFKKFSKKMEFKLCCRNRPRLNKCLNTVVIVTVGVALFFVIPAAIFMKLEGWDYGSAIYYGIITATTVGFGDLVAAWDCVGEPCWLYRVSVGIWIFLGLAWLASVIASMQEAIESLISKADPKSKKKPSDDETKPDSNGVAGTEATEGAENLETIAVDPKDPSNPNDSSGPKDTSDPNDPSGSTDNEAQRESVRL